MGDRPPVRIWGGHPVSSNQANILQCGAVCWFCLVLVRLKLFIVLRRFLLNFTLYFGLGIC